jgi:hypothetical protein
MIMHWTLHIGALMESGEVAKGVEEGRVQLLFVKPEQRLAL